MYEENIIINNDFDGILCGKILSELYDCKIVGFTTSKDKILLIDENTVLENCVFVDICTPNFTCIDQHIPPVHHKKQTNPNTDRKRYTFVNYGKKYPFSTAVYLLCVAAKEGKNIGKYISKSPEIWKDGKFRPIDILLRADDTLTTSHHPYYKDNAKEWWEWLYELSGKNEHIRRLIEIVYSVDYPFCEKWKKNIDTYFHFEYGFNGEELPNVESEKASTFLSRYGVENVSIRKTIPLIHKRTTITTIEEFNSLVDSPDFFSYAFVYSPKSVDKLNFSYSKFNND